MVIMAGAMAVAHAPRAQQTTTAVIGVFAANGANVDLIRGFRQGLSEAGYVDGENLTIEYRWAEGHYDRLPAFAQSLSAAK